MKFKHLLALVLAICFTANAFAQKKSPKKQEIAVEQFTAIADSIHSYLRPFAIVGGNITVENVYIYPEKQMDIHFSRVLGDYPIRDVDVKVLYSIIKSLLPEGYEGYTVTGYSSKSTFEELSSPYYSGRKSATAAASKKGKTPVVNKWVSRIDPEYTVSKGLQNSHIAMWQSHGWYYEQKLMRWEWQRARIFQTVEDLYTQSYVVPFLVPMLENAGAYVAMPRERDFHSFELIVDNDAASTSRTGGKYSETGNWTEGSAPAFADAKESYEYQENPFQMGTSRQVAAVKGEKATATASWSTHVDEDGEYAVYVSYSTLPNSTDCAQYKVKYEGGEQSFSVNQTMGGGTWVYVGKFPFKVGKEYSVELSNSTPKGKVYREKTVVSADAVKVGGGMGNIARKPSKEIISNMQSAKDLDNNPIEMPDFNYVSEVSGYSRIREGARYWLQWAGFSDTIYSPNKNMNDYNDDYMSRGRWVNVLSGGSKVNPKEKGYNVPLDLSMAFHTDAGTTMDDEMIGTLSIYTRFSNNKDVFPTGESRMANRELADLIQTQIVDDVRALYEENWPRRGLWDRSYNESRTPEIPSMLLEFLSHQNLADMRYGNDPRFRFSVSRAIYKAMLRFQAGRYGFEYVVQPLPVESFAAVLVDNNNNKPSVKLSWNGVEDPLEPTATPTGYVVYYSKEGGESGYKVVGPKDGTTLTMEIDPDAVYSFKVVATNAGGASFPSEELSVGTTADWKNNYTVLVMNGFDRVSAAASFATKDSTRAGFDNFLDSGVPFINDYAYIGAQHEYRRHIPWMDDDSPGFGAAYANYEDKVVAGNTFDYPRKHGKSILKAGFNYVSASRSAVANGTVSLCDYPVVDMIMGKQVKTQMGRDGANKAQFEVFTPLLQKQITKYCQNGGRLLISGSYVASDIWDNLLDNEPSRPSHTGEVKDIVKSLQKTSSDLQELLNTLHAEYTEVQKSNESLGFEYYKYDEEAVRKITETIDLSNKYIDSIGSTLAVTNKDLKAFEKGTDADERSKSFAEEVLKFRWMTHYASATGEVKLAQNPLGVGYNKIPSGVYSFNTRPNAKVYSVESPDGLVPVGPNAWTIFRYADNNISAGVAYKGADYRCVTLGFPIETLETEEQIDAILADILKFLTAEE